MSDQAALDFLRWFWTAFFAAFGVYYLIRPDCMMRTSCKVVRLQEPSDADRVNAAVERRRKVEHISHALGYAAAVFAFLCAFLCGFHVLQPVLLYALFCLGLALTMSGAYLQLRNSQPKRVAVLAPRTPRTVIPDWVFVAAGVSAFVALPLVLVPQYAISASFVFLSTLLTLGAAWRLTSLPALLQGVDLGAESLLDSRLRFNRSGTVLILSVVQPFVLCSQAMQSDSPVAVAGYAITLVIFLSVALWFARKLFAKVSLAPQ